jgi:hypothetical protein
VTKVNDGMLPLTRRFWKTPTELPLPVLILGTSMGTSVTLSSWYCVAHFSPCRADQAEPNRETTLNDSTSLILPHIKTIHAWSICRVDDG